MIISDTVLILHHLSFGRALWGKPGDIWFSENKIVQNVEVIDDEPDTK